jgi:hypothetical protein
MTLAECRGLAPGDYVFHEAAIWRVASPPLVRRRAGFRVRLEAASGAAGVPVEVAPGELRAFGKRRRVSRANQWLAARLASIVTRHDREVR